MRRILLAFTATALVVAGSYAVRPAPDSPSGSEPLLSSSPQLSPPLDSPRSVEDRVPAELDRLIRVFGERTTASVDPLDFRTYGGHLYARAKITGSIEDYVAAREAYATATELAPGDREGTLGYARATMAVHRFADAFELAESLLAVDPADADALAIAADASVELGELKRAEELLLRLEGATPDNPAVLARLAGLAHLNGEQSEAIALAENAAAEAIALPLGNQVAAFYPLLLADLLLDAGRYEDAAEATDVALAIDPEYPTAIASRARVLAHRGDHEAALATYQQALAMQPDPGWDVAAAELLTALGRTDEAGSHYESALDQLAGVDEVIFGQELAAIYADLGIEAEEALRLAEDDFARRQTVGTYDALAWTLYRNGRLDDARRAIDNARASGAQDAAVIYHSAVIAAAQGDEVHAIAELNELLDRNPGFHPLQSRHAAALLAELTR